MAVIEEGLVRLDSWKDIALYLDRDVRTVMRWEKTRGLPVRRLPGEARSTVYAFKTEIDAWLRGNPGVLGVPLGDTPASAASVDGFSNASAGDPSIGAASRAEKRPGWRTVTLAVMTVAACGGIVAALGLRPASPDLDVADPARISESQTQILSPLLTDGSRIYFPQHESNRYSVGSLPANGGQTRPVATSVNNAELCDLAPHSHTMLLRRLIYSRDEIAPVYIQAQDAPAQRVGNVLAYDAAWYPDERRILYSVDRAVYATDRTGSSPQRLFDLPGNAYWFRWSPEGDVVRFSVIDAKTEETSIWEASISGGKPHRLFPKVPFHLCCGTWTPDGSHYLFQARVGNTFQIWAQRELSGFRFAAEKPVFPLLAGAFSYRGAVVSPDSRKLYLRAEAAKSELVRFDRTSGRFLPFLPSLPVRTLAFSKDGSQIAYTSLADNQLWRCHSDGRQCVELTKGLKQTIMPRWSPDGQTIAFMGLYFTGGWGVLTVPAEGGAVRPLSDRSQPKGNPDWSPDSGRLVFGDVPPVSERGGISVLEVGTNQMTELPGSKGLYSPRWSPDGRYLVALHGGDLHLRLYDFRSAKWRELTKSSAGYPAWSHDGKWVYFLSSEGQGRAVSRVTVADARVEKVADLAGVERGSFFMNDWIGLSSDDAPLAVHDLTTDDIYAWKLVPR